MAATSYRTKRIRRCWAKQEKAENADLVRKNIPDTITGEHEDVRLIAEGLEGERGQVGLWAYEGLIRLVA